MKWSLVVGLLFCGVFCSGAFAQDAWTPVEEYHLIPVVQYEATWDYRAFGAGPLAIPREHWTVTGPGYRSSTQRGLIWEYRDTTKSGFYGSHRRRQLFLFGIPMLPSDTYNSRGSLNLFVTP